MVCPSVDDAPDEEVVVRADAPSDSPSKRARRHMDSLLFIKFFMFKSMESAGELVDKVTAAVGLRR